VEGAALPHPDPQDPDTMAAGVSKRFGIKPPPFCPDTMNRLKIFTDKWCEGHLIPIAADADTSVESWLEKTNYSAGRRAELLEKWRNVDDIWDPSKKYFHNKMFMKDETYPEYKHARAINSRSDEFKCAVGPIFKLMEEKVYKLKSFIKHTPVADRPKVIMEHLFKVGVDTKSGDFTAYESSFIRELMESCEFRVYKHLVSKLNEGDNFMRLISTVLLGDNECVHWLLTVLLDCTRMSGEMNTSLGNTLATHLIILFLCEEAGYTEVEDKVEGDDSLFNGNGPDDRPNTEDFAKLGLRMKLEHHEALNEASFCGIIFDLEDKINVTDPRKVLAGFGWTTRQYARSGDSKKRALIRCKALSYAHQYPGCPIIGALASYGLRNTRGYEQAARDIVLKAKHTNSYWKDKMIAAFKDEKKIRYVEPPINTRLLVEKKYGIPIETQIHIEKYLLGLRSIQTLRDPLIMDLMEPVWQHYWDNYSHVESRKSPLLEYPAKTFPQLDGFKSEIIYASPLDVAARRRARTSPVNWIVP